MYHGVERKRKINPKEKANFVSLITFFFTFDLLKKGKKKDIEEKDIYDVITQFKSSTLGNELEKHWQKQKSKTGAFSIFRLLWNCYGKYYLFWGVIQLGMKIALVMIQPRALGKLVSYFSNNKDKISKRDAIYYAAVLLIFNAVYFVYAHNYMFVITELGIKVRTAFCSLIYRKSLKLSYSSLSKITVGKIVTLISKDVNSFDSAIIFLNDIWISVIVLVITSTLIYSRLGIASLGGILFIICVIPLQVYVGKLASNLRIKAAGITDRRLQIIQETLSAIKIIKMYTWEKFFGDQIAKLRKKEVKKIKLIYFAKATCLIVSGLVSNITLYIIITTYTSLGNIFTAELVFFLMGCLYAIRSSVTVSIPIGIAQVAELVASAKRINAVLTAEEHTKSEKDNNVKPLILMENVSVEIQDTLILHDVNMKINSGFNFVTGRLGGGKSSILKTILEIYPISGGKLNVQGKISYAPEEPWLFPSSIRQNILFGQKFDNERYKKVLHVCALEMDIDSLEEGDRTILGDRGMNLSKGQQARISLARAVYCDSDIYLLDDCLSALDAHVQQYVFEECILNFLKDKIVVMISHNEKQLKNADNIIIVENGTIKSCTKPSEIADEEIEQIVREEDKEEDDIIDNIEIDTDEDTTEDSKLMQTDTEHNIYHENKKEGDVNLNVYMKYFSFGGGKFAVFAICLIFIVSQGGVSISDKLVGKWVRIQQNISEYNTQNITNMTEYEKVLKENKRVFSTYSTLILISTILIFVRTYAHFTFAGKASVRLHKSMVLSVVNATMKFFDLHYFGNILNRFAKDFGTVDEYLPLILYECLRSVCALGGIIIVTAVINYFFILPAAAIFIMAFLICNYYIPTGRSVKRLESATRSPVIGHINASLEGLSTIRVHGTENLLREEFDKHQDLYTSTFYMMQSALRFFAFSMDVLCNCFINFIVITFLVVDTGTHAGDVGVAITQSFALTGLLQWSIRQFAELENQMTSVERVLEYTDTEQENKTGRILENWPSRGKITYKNVNLNYGTSKEDVLKNINFTINPGEKIGIVGRTGAGKSSLISTLFRLYPFEGIVAIDDVDIKTLSLDFLRSSIAIIPQDPTLFTGSIRANIDPTGQHGDDKIWKVVEMAKLKELVPNLDYQISEGGANFSAGQRQLICLARAIISKNKIIILDEATSNMDPESDVLIYTTIQENFADCTVVTIAHRLHTVVYSDKVIVVDKGQIVEFDDPNTLLSDKNGFFYKMVQQGNWIK